ncbi:hypothetical protein AVEN_119322-1 [Araneus ventricosus]|uniref:Uncharacterized protein n=1 Tax=Araneus ventricosus TaxID=182803 RepID=A0A4Y2HZP9_ARAVE|nr:hypothetical protein AVEN_119322-1 [Araneus ventricosus]
MVAARFFPDRSALPDQSLFISSSCGIAISGNHCYSSRLFRLLQINKHETEYTVINPDFNEEYIGNAIRVIGSWNTLRRKSFSGETSSED